MSNQFGDFYHANTNPYPNGNPYKQGYSVMTYYEVTMYEDGNMPHVVNMVQTFDVIGNDCPRLILTKHDGTQVVFMLNNYLFYEIERMTQH